jgi:hypothetical protein
MTTYTNVPTVDTSLTQTAAKSLQNLREGLQQSRLDKLIEQVGKSEWIKELAPGVTPEQVREIINYEHIHFEKAYPGLPVSNETATVSCPDHSVHIVQITVDEPGSPKNHLCCITCYDPKNRTHCAAAVAAFVVKLAERPPLKKEKEDVCPGCGGVLV